MYYQPRPYSSGEGDTILEQLDSIVPPCDMEAEQSTLGCMLSSPVAAAMGFELLRTDDFYRDMHRTIFDGMCALHVGAQAIDPVTVASELERTGKLDEAGGTAFLRALVDGVPDVDHARSYADAVKDAATARKVLLTTYEIQDTIRGGNSSPSELLERLEQTVSRISNEAKRGDFLPIADIIMERYIHLGEDLTEGSVSTGFVNIDALISGFSPSRLYILAARPGEGKTTLAMNMAQRISLTKSGSVLFFSLEMTKEELTDRVISSTAGVMSYKMQTGDLNRDDWARLYEAINAVERADLQIDDDASVTMFELRAKAKRFAATHRISLIVVDYLQLLSLGHSAPTREREVADMTRALKLMAKELSVPILVVSQLNRNPEGRRSREPELSDLRESGAIEQDADVVMFIHNDPDDESRTMARVLVKKNRHGPTGAAHLVFTREYTRFRDEVRASQ